MIWYHWGRFCLVLFLLSNVTFRMVATLGASGVSDGIGHRTYRRVSGIGQKMDGLMQ